MCPQPGPRKSPLTVNSPWPQIQDLGNLGNGEPCEYPQFGNLPSLSIQPGQLVEQVVQCHELSRVDPSGDSDCLERHSAPIGSPFCGRFIAGMIEQNASHR